MRSDSNGPRPIHPLNQQSLLSQFIRPYQKYFLVKKLTKKLYSLILENALPVLIQKASPVDKLFVIMVRAFLRKNVPEPIKEPVKKVLKDYGQATSKWRALPDWLIIGAQKGGTSSLFFYLQQHPEIGFAPEITKEVHYFDWHHQHYLDWYRAHFPLKISYKLSNIRSTGEATPEYLFHPLAPNRISKSLPDAKFLIILRNPINRAYSHWKMSIRHGHETLNFLDAIEAEEDRLGQEREHLKTQGDEYSWHSPLAWFSYLSRGRYTEQIEHWLKFFSREKLLILRSEDMFSNPHEVLSKTTHFLELKEFKRIDLEPMNTGGYQKKMPPETYKKLAAYFAPHNQNLLKYVDWDPKW
ncbi:sulfotransferase [Leptolyngbyaceae cyanobacterium CCMR0082]|uniref:Sulfotransferase n=2 Tax=Adonisia turfae TaxID=2950184 RepID=A0A6M0S1H7_9CYAN|nr:sulfotransferase domain-containing protein [Adonisia turfae]MDV3347652.1 sulfotransferase domain-containing protein [Leptothoe sp. LEGE 181152]NEZ55798.1 sulfotransferase [Adonisia turfae CCMR0081]NEZ62329.1 sulfotransferase [Adonisia turfae CCMR0082]